MTTATIRYNPQNSTVSDCLAFLSTIKGVKILSETNLPKAESPGKLSAKREKELFFAGSKRSMSKHFEKYL